VRKDCFVRAGGVDYSVPPGLVGRRVTVALSLRRIVVRLEGTIVAEHDRSYVPADVVTAPNHLALLAEHREARRNLNTGDVDVPVCDLGVFDRLVGGL
jgi:hypothetical protein